MVVVEAVDDSPRDAQHIARADVGLCSVERPGQHTLKPVDRLLITVMAVGGRHSGCGWDVELEDCHRTSRLLAFEPESHRNLPDPDLFRHIEVSFRLSCCLYQHPTPWKGRLKRCGRSARATEANFGEHVFHAIGRIEAESKGGMPLNSWRSSC